MRFEVEREEEQREVGENEHDSCVNHQRSTTLCWAGIGYTHGRSRSVHAHPAFRWNGPLCAGQSGSSSSSSTPSLNSSLTR